MEESKSTLKILTGKHARKRPLGRVGVDTKTMIEWILKK
jgi:hypothetical protein